MEKQGDGCRQLRPLPLFEPKRQGGNFYTIQDDLRKRCRFLKGEKGIDYKEIAEAIGMTTNSFYNFMSGRQTKLGYRREGLLKNYLDKEEKK